MATEFIVSHARARLVHPPLGWCLERRTPNSLIGAVGPASDIWGEHVLRNVVLTRRGVYEQLERYRARTFTVTSNPRERAAASRCDPQ